ncbi:MAG TPA: ECF transporter S component [Candidatus Ornithocaccomicrobium faecavium]|uniref:ECF transporter S component n=1 Tax=Candidatus Ornithocaccomicrobium faecavium TaxID=2840890 RepID=A0A9D1P7R8_9FIRM|nr:ECF transporter S component [Candidatus Ornithocaccomicrobium faecavium]
MHRNQIRRLTLTAMFIALGYLLPFLTGQIPQFGTMLSPMHIPALLCGFVCGWQYGLVAGAIMPLLRSATLGMPPMFPTAVAMAFELAAYGCAAGLLYRALPKHIAFVYVTLVLSMLIGRAVWGLASAVLMMGTENVFTTQAFLAGAFINAWPGIVLHILVIPPVVLGLRRAKLMD